MRPRYWSRAAPAQAGSLFATARTCSLGTGRTNRGALSLRGLRFRRRFQLHFLAAPQLLQVVVAANRRVHDVHHDVAEVDQHPIAVALALDADDSRAHRLELFLHAARERVHLAAGVAARDHHALEVGGLAGDVVDHHVARLDVFERFDHRTLLLADVHQRYSPCARI